jgi:hypothetical protein
MDEPYQSSSAEQPKSDRELLLLIHSDMKQLKTEIGSICNQIKDHDDRIDKLENWRWYFVGGLSILTFILVLFGRYIDLGGKV